MAEQLLARGIPFVLASGYGDWSLPENLRNQPRLTKPFTQVDLEQHKLPARYLTTLHVDGILGATSHPENQQA